MSASIITDTSVIKPLVSARVYDLIVDGSSTLSGLTVDNLNITNGTGSVDLTTDNSGDLLISGVINTPGLQFTNPVTTQSELSIYNLGTSDNVISFNYIATPVGQLTCRFERVGQTIFCETRGFMDFATAVGTAIATSAIPSIYRPAHDITITIPFYLSTATPSFIIAFLSIATNGIMSLYTSAPAPGPSTYNTGIHTGPSNYDRYTFCYRF